MKGNVVARIALNLIAGFGALAGAGLSVKHLQTGEVCPVLGPVPACNVVFLGYLGVLIAAFMIRKKWSNKLFYPGIIPVFLLALIGVVLEIIRGSICPPGPLNIPQCYFSLAMAVTCLFLFHYLYRTMNETK